MAMSKIELTNFLHSCGIEDVTEALRLKSINVSDWKILEIHKIPKKSYQRWAHEYSSIVGKSVAVRKRGKLVAMCCPECKGIMRWDRKHDKVCDKCGYIISPIEQKSERIREALRHIGKPATTKSRKQKIESFLKIGLDEDAIIRILATM